MLESGEVTSVMLVNIFGHRCYTLGRNLGLTAEELFESALKDAHEKDHLRKQGKTTGSPLFGVPMAIKDCCKVKGSRSTTGCTSLVDYIPEEDAAIVSCLRKAGAIFLVRGNVPNMLQSFQTKSFWGVAKNP